ncbi:MAG: helix-turn-helix domain-containing protein [Ruminococcaceae bacterium]|nr:helix-turn-helix domain-containing protein [Oscillospiraceae bacterium]
MYPRNLEMQKGLAYYRESDCFTQDPQNLVHAYLHENYTHKMHVHQFCEMNIIVSGEGQHYIGDFSIPASIGDVFVIPPTVAHGYFSHGRLDILHILLRADFMHRYREELCRLPSYSLLFDIEPQIRLSSGGEYNLRIPSHCFPALQEEIYRLISLEKAKEYTYQNVLTLGFIGKLGELLRQSMQNETIRTRDRGLLEVMEYIRENLDQKLTLELLASKVSLSKSTLNRRFVETLHVSPMQYVMKCRLEKAKALLSQGELSKTEIAHFCGFFDIAHMNKYL